MLTPGQWNAVALWAWDIVVDNCAICRNHIMDLCALMKRSQRAASLLLHVLRLAANGGIAIAIRHRVSGKPSFSHQRRVHCSMGHLQCELL